MKIKPFEGSPCRRCGTPLVKIVRNATPENKGKRAFFYAYWFRCPGCKAIFHVKEAARPWGTVLPAGETDTAGVTRNQFRDLSQKARLTKEEVRAVNKAERKRKKRERKAERRKLRQKAIALGKPSDWYIKYKEYLNSPQWQRFRRQIFEQRGRRCERCLKPAMVLHLHHKTYQRFGKELPEDVEILCAPCHEKEHGRGFHDGKAPQPWEKQENAA